jgi:hypothetical protein
MTFALLMRRASARLEIARVYEAAGLHGSAARERMAALALLECAESIA